jgi:hypothetical protein
MIGFHQISTIGFGLMTVSSASLVHSHQARITVFIYYKQELKIDNIYLQLT